jgi:DNA-binding SARP family transcriptional activator
MAGPRLTLRVLGGFDARLDGARTFEIPSRKTRALLAYLALSGGHFQSRERLAALLWSDRGDSQANSSLRQALVELNRASEAADLALLIMRQDAVAIDPAAVEVDALEFQRLGGWQ